MARSNKPVAIPVLSKETPCASWQTTFREALLAFVYLDELSELDTNPKSCAFTIIDSYSLNKKQLSNALNLCRQQHMPVLLLGTKSKVNSDLLKNFTANICLLAKNASLEACRKTCLAFLLQYAKSKHTNLTPFNLHELYQQPVQILELSDHIQLEEHVNTALTHAKAHGFNISLLNIDIDNFKKINTAYGYQTGDHIIDQLGQRLLHNIRGEDIIFHLPGDRFVALITHMQQPEKIGLLAKRLLHLNQQALEIDDQQIFIKMSIGIASYPQAGREAQELIKHAETACFYGKMKEEQTYRYSDQHIHAKHIELLKIEQALYSAIDNHEFHLLFQPIFDINTNEIVGMEALTRWKNPQFGAISPNIFMPLAEQAQLTNQLGQWVISTVCQQLQTWQQAGFKALNMTVNVSLQQILHQSFITSLKQCLNKYQINPQHLTIEITESLISEQEDRFVEVMQALNELGVQIAIDDFGSGNAVLNRLKNIPFSTIKISQNFISQLEHNPVDQHIVKAIIKLADKLQLTVIAEGIKNKAQIEFLQKQACRLAQGYFFSKPIPAEMMALLLRKHRCSA